MKDKLKALSFDDDTIEKVEAILRDEIKDKYIPKARFDEINDAKKRFEEVVGERDAQLEELRNTVGNEEKLKKRIEELQADNQKAKDEFDATLKAMKRDSYVNNTLLEAGLIDTKYIPGISAYLPINELDIDSVTSVEEFKQKLDDVKTTIAPGWFKSNEPLPTELNGLKVNDPTTKVAPGDEFVDKTSYEYMLAQALKQ